MKRYKEIIIKASLLLIVFTVLCGIIYPTIITGLSQILFPYQANGSIIEIDGKKYGSELLGQPFVQENHMWGRIMNIDTTTYVDENDHILLYAYPSNLSVTSKEFEMKIQQRIIQIKEANPEMDGQAIPVDLVTVSGSGLDPHISKAAANYQVKRIAKTNHMSENEVIEIIETCTEKKMFGLFGEEVVNVLKVNLMLEEILESE